jgi:hypothetical protein
MAMVLTGPSLFAQEKASSPADKVSVTLEFGTSLLAVTNDGDETVVDSLTDTGFGEDHESTLGIAYEDEFWGASASLAFATDPDLYIMGESEGEALPLAIDELYVWVKPFGEHFKFTGGIFENTDGVADYTDDIDNFGMGAFYDASEGDNGAYTEPVPLVNGTALVNGFLAEAAFGPITAQLHLAPNLNNKAGGAYFTDIFKNEYGMDIPVEDAGARLFRIGGRLIADIGVGTVSALFKTQSFPIKPFNDMYALMPDPISWPGEVMDMTTFGAYVDLTAVENLGVSLGYTGFVLGNDDSDAKKSVYSGIDLRATWTGIEGLSLSTHNNVSFAKGEDWYYGREAGSSFFTVYNAIGATKELTEKFSVNAEVGNIFSKTDSKSPAGDAEIEHNNFWGGLKLITSLTENVEFNTGLKVDFANTAMTGEEDVTITTFSIPVGIIVSF